MWYNSLTAVAAVTAASLMLRAFDVQTEYKPSELPPFPLVFIKRSRITSPAGFKTRDSHGTTQPRLIASTRTQVHSHEYLSWNKATSRRRLVDVGFALAVSALAVWLDRRTEYYILLPSLSLVSSHFNTKTSVSQQHVSKLMNTA